MKKCTACECDLDLSNFYKDKSKADGLSTRCKPCIKIAANTPDRVEKRKATRRAFYAKTPEKIKAQNKQWVAKNLEKVIAKNAEWARNNPEKRKDILRRYKENNYEKEKARSLRYYYENKEKRLAYGNKNRAKNIERHREYVRNWQSRNKFHLAKNLANRRAKKIESTPGWCDHKTVTEIYKAADLITKSTGIQHHVDHIVPLRSSIVCGLHTHTNLRVITYEENMKKGNRFWPDMP